jgi:uncharacterized protein involved in outer membrane biogenesis
MSESTNGGKGVLRSFLLNKWFLGVVIAVTIYTLAGFFLIPYFVKSELVGFVETQLKRRLAVEEVALNPYQLTFAMRGLRLEEAGGEPLCAFRELFVDFDLASLWNKAWTFSEVRIEEPAVEVKLLKNGRLNWAALADDLPPEEPSTEPEPESGPVPVLLQHAALHGGRVHYTDLTQGKPAETTLAPLDFELHNLSTLQDHSGSTTLSATLAGGGTFNWTGDVSLTPLKSTGKLRLEGFRPAGLWPFLQGRVPLREPGGVVQFDTSYRLEDSDAGIRLALDPLRFGVDGLDLAQQSGANPLGLRVQKAAIQLKANIDAGPNKTQAVVDNLDIGLTGIGMGAAGEKEPLATLDKLNVDGVKLDLAARSLHIGKVALAGGRSRVARETDGQINLVRMFGQTPEGNTAPPNKSADKEEGADANPWSIAVDAVELNDHTTSISDRAVKPEVDLEVRHIQAALSNIKHPGEAPINIKAGLELSTGGTLGVEGTFAPATTALETQVEVKQLKLPVIQPYLSQVALIRLESGDVSVAGKASLKGGDGGPTVHFAGKMDSNQLMIKDAEGRERLLAWKALEVKDVEFGLKPDKLTIAEARLQEPGAKLVIFKDKSLNLAKVIKPQTGTGAVSNPPSQKTAEEASFPVTVKRVRVDRATVDFADLSLVFPFAAHIEDLSGVVSGLSSDPKSRASMKLQGEVKPDGLVQVNGDINLAQPKSYMDIGLSFRNTDMPTLSPYSATFAGRRIASGKLSLDLEYKITDHTLAGNNKVLLDHFTLGERVESPDATDLPLDLAVALLTGTDGKIDLAIPVKGDVNSPEFSYGGVIWQAITGLITSAATAPFRMLAGVLGGDGEDLGAVAFAPGGADLLPPEREKLGKLTQALKSRPTLKLTVQGRYHVDRDGEALKALHVREALAEREGIEVEKGGDPGPVAFSEADTQKALGEELEARLSEDGAAAFQKDFEVKSGRKAEAVSAVLAMVGKASPDTAFYEAMYQKLVETYPLPEAELKALADRRGAAIVEALSAKGGIEPKRIAAGASAATTEANDVGVPVTLALGAL